MRRFKDSPLGRIPEEWDIFILGDVCTDIQDGTHYSPQTNDDGNFMYITSKNIKFGHLDLSYVGYISKKEHEKIYNRCRVKHGDILLTKDGVNTGNAAINIIKEPFSLLSSVAYLRPNKTSIVASIYPADKKDFRFLNSSSLSNSNRRTLSLSHGISRFD